MKLTLVLLLSTALLGLAYGQASLTLSCGGGSSNGQGTFFFPFTVLVTNTGTLTLTGITVILQQPGIFVGTIGSLAPGASTTLTGTVQSSSSSLRIGPAVLSASAGNFAVSAASSTAQCTTSAVTTTSTTTRPPFNPQILVTKNCTAVFNSTTNTIVVFFTITVRNTGNVPFTSLSIVENTGAPLPQSAQALAVGQQVVVSSSYIPTDQSASSFTDTVTVFAVASGETEARTFGPVSATCPRPVTGNVNIAVMKSCSVSIVNNRPRVTFVILITNIGTVPLARLTILEAESPTGLASQNFVISSGLPVGASTTINGSYTPSNSQASTFNDSVTVVVQAVNSQTTQTFGPFFASCSLAPAARISVTKNCTAVQVLLSNGQTEIQVFFTVVITNTGSVPIESFTATENTGASLQPQTAAAIPVGGSVVLNAAYTPSNQNALNFTDTVTVFAVPSGSNSVITATASATCPAPPSTFTSTTPPRGAALDISKSCTVSVNAQGKVVVSFTIMVSNVGTVGFSTLTILEAENGTQAASQNFIISSGLATGASTSIQGSYTPTVQSASSFTDVVSVVGTPVATSLNPNPLPIMFGPRTATCFRPAVTPGREYEEEELDAA